MKVKLKRIEMGIKQKDLAKRLGISRITLARIERDECDIRLSLMQRIAKILNSSIYELFFNE